MIRYRLAADFFLLVSIVVFPYWITLLVGAVFLFYFRDFYEYIVAALIMDLLYGGGTIRVLNIPFILSFVSVVLYVSVTLLKRRIILYD